MARAMSTLIARITCLLLNVYHTIAARSEIQLHRATEGKGSAMNNLDCDCLRTLECTSCSFKTCPFSRNGFLKAEAFSEGGTDRVHGVAAWRVHAQGGHEYVLKFGGEDKEKAIRAGQLAHALGVITPRQLVFNSSSCQELWDQVNISALPAALGKSLLEWDEKKKTVVVQELAKDADDPAMVEEANASGPETSLWYQVGKIAAFDWLVGKSDLFNDVSMDFSESGTAIEDTKSNWGNLIIDQDRCVEIDLGIGMPYTRYEYWESALKELRMQQQPVAIEWVSRVLLPMLSLIKSKGAQEYPSSAFNAMTPSDPNGFKAGLSPLIVQLGMVEALLRALELLREGSSRVQTVHGEPMPGFLHATKALGEWPMEALMAIRDSHRQAIQGQWQVLVSEYNTRKQAEERAGKRCCEVTCSKKRSRTFTDWRTREECLTKTHMVVKLNRVVYREGSVGYRRYGNPYEDSCEDAFNKRAWQSQLCEKVCGDEAVKPQVAALNDVHFSLCGM
eukprot:TRINITY_DN60057_c0_g1_i1.p1 TRINITY_DN60057_c0_g1~~TRINITY_DN60057_c0_g1_i1.p1  ORF type:complete len:505 (+),score=83.49 TRINITY_DN60057_c0_g1_i1:77-1591(+)